LNNADLLNALPDDVLVKIWANSPTEKEVRGLVGISQNTIKKWLESGTSAQIGQIATAIRRAYHNETPVPETSEVIFD
jgi:hypothetical protein